MESSHWVVNALLTDVAPRRRRTYDTYLVVLGWHTA